MRKEKNKARWDKHPVNFCLYSTRGRNVYGMDCRPTIDSEGIS